MSSLRLTQILSQRMVLTPQLRQRIEMLQMTTLELSDLIQQEIVSNPVLEEVQTEEEFEEIEDLEETALLEFNEERREALTSLASQLLELREMLKINKTDVVNSAQRKY